MQKLAGALLVALALAGTAVVASAQAAPAWYSAKPEWTLAGAGLGEAAPVTWSGALSFHDTAGFAPVVECESAAEGSVGPGGAGEVSKWSTSKCVTRSGECGKPSILAMHLPWRTALDGVTDSIFEDGKGVPGYALTCETFIGTIKDACTGVFKAPTSNLAEAVQASLIGQKLNCAYQNGSGTVEGVHTIAATGGASLQVSAHYSALSGAHEVDDSGELTILDSEVSHFGATCAVQMRGTIEALGNGTVSAYTVSGCGKTSGTCESVSSVVPVHLPWKTELYEAGGRIRERLASSGAGTPQVQLNCTYHGAPVSDTCGLDTSLGLSNSLETFVTGEFDAESAKTGCTRGGAGTGIWSGRLQIAPIGEEAIEVK